MSTQQQYDRTQQYDQQRPQRDPVVPLVLKPEDIEEILGLMANGQRKFTPAEINLICDTQQTGIAFSMQLTDFKRLMYLCSLRDLNPLANEIHIEYRWDKQAGCAKAANVTHIDGYRKIAAATGQLDGREVNYGEDAAGNLIWAEAIVYRKDCQRPFKSKCWKSEFLGTNYMHAKMPHAILGKDAEAAGLRAAFAAELAGLVVEEEMQAPAARYTPGEEPASEDTKLAAAQPANGGAAVTNVGGFAVGVKPEPAPTQEQASQAQAGNGTAPAVEAPQQPTETKEPTIKERLEAATKALFAQSKLKGNALRAFSMGYFAFPDAMSPASKEGVEALKTISAEQALSSIEKLLDAFKADNRTLEAYSVDPRRLGKTLRPKAEGEPESAATETKPPATETTAAPAETTKPAPAPDKPKAETKSGNGTNGAARKQNHVDIIAHTLRCDRQMAGLVAEYCNRRDCTVQQAVEQWKSAGVVLDGDAKWPHGRIESYLAVAVHATNAHELVAAFLREKVPMAQMLQEVEKRIGKRLLTDGKPTEGIDSTVLMQAVSAVASEGAKPGLF